MKKKIKQKLSNRLRLNFWQKSVRFNEIIWLIIVMKTKMISTWKTYKQDRPFIDLDININIVMQNTTCLGKILFIFNKQHLSTSWGSIHGKVKQHWNWVEKNALLTKKHVFKRCDLTYQTFCHSHGITIQSASLFIESGGLMCSLTTNN